MVAVRSVLAAREAELTMRVLGFLLFCTEAVKSTLCSAKNAEHLGNEEKNQGMWASSLIL